MKKNNKKGFTIVELVIVIAVIAILAAVLIPTFTGVTEKAQKSAAMQEANNAWINYLAEKIDTNAYEENICIKSGDYYFHVVNGVFDEEAVENHSSPCAVFVKMTVVGDSLRFDEMEKAKTAWKNYITSNPGSATTSFCIKSGDYYFHVVNGVFNEKANNNTHTCGYTSAEVTGSTLTVPTP